MRIDMYRLRWHDKTAFASHASATHGIPLVGHAINKLACVVMQHKTCKSV